MKAASSVIPSSISQAWLTILDCETTRENVTSLKICKRNSTLKLHKIQLLIRLKTLMEHGKFYVRNSWLCDYFIIMLSDDEIT
jgi:hypothetical protein